MSEESGAEPAEMGQAATEPIRSPWLWAGVIILLIAGVPWYVPGGAIEPIVMGLPLWTWTAMGATVAMCGYLHWAIVRHWKLVEDVEERTGGSIGPESDLAADVYADGPRGR